MLKLLLLYKRHPRWYQTSPVTTIHLDVGLCNPASPSANAVRLPEFHQEDNKMGYTALITLDLPGAENNRRDAFYESLTQNNWQKISDLTTAWTVSFNDDTSRSDAIEELKIDLRTAKQHSKISKYRFAIQMGKARVEISND